VSDVANPKSKSLELVVVAKPLLGELLVPLAAAVTSNPPLKPEYSAIRMEKYAALPEFTVAVTLSLEAPEQPLQ
jgi:hypothetical protein